MVSGSWAKCRKGGFWRTLIVKNLNLRSFGEFGVGSKPLWPAVAQHWTSPCPPRWALASLRSPALAMSPAPATATRATPSSPVPMSSRRRVGRRCERLLHPGPGEKQGKSVVFRCFSYSMGFPIGFKFFPQYVGMRLTFYAFELDLVFFIIFVYNFWRPKVVFWKVVAWHFVSCFVVLVKFPDLPVEDCGFAFSGRDRNGVLWVLPTRKWYLLSKKRWFDIPQEIATFGLQHVMVFCRFSPEKSQQQGGKE